MSNSYAEGQSGPYAEDKKCRICGLADISNVNIFNGSNKSLLTKVLTVYPIVLYANDPLPKNICKKCIHNVGIMYNDIQRVLKTQSKWINNVRSVQPNHNYIRVLDLIEHTNSVMRVSIKSILGEDFCQQSVNRLLMPQPEPTEFTRFHITSHQTPSNSKVNHVPSTKVTKGNSSELVNCTPKINDIKSILEQNGCSLLAVNEKVVNKTISKSNVAVNITAEPIIIKEELVDDNENTTQLDEDDIKLSQFATSVTQYSKQDFSTPPPLKVKCRYCPQQFQTLAALAVHQLIHMQLQLPKILEKKFLPKNVRRGRLIIVQQRKCIRCLNCWRVFVDNKSILDHWSLGECDFYCQICGQEFSQAPKMLREHVPAAHGVSYRSSKMLRLNLTSGMRSSMQQMSPLETPDYRLYGQLSEQEPLQFEEDNGRSGSPTVSSAKQQSNINLLHSIFAPTPPKTSTSASKGRNSKSHDGRATCRICHRSFQNMKARNSHMRMHKPSHAYRDVVLPTNAGADDYTKMEHENSYGQDDTEPAHIAKKPKINNEQLPAPSFMQNSESKSSTIMPPRPFTTSNIVSSSSRAISSVIRGIRTKFVNRRSDLPNSATTEKSIGLQSTSGTTNAIPLTTESANTSNAITTPECTPNLSCTVIKNEPLDDDEVMDFSIPPAAFKIG